MGVPMTRRVLAFLLLGLVVLVIGVLLWRPSTDETSFRVVVVSLVEIEPIAALRRGFQAEMKGSSLGRTRNVVFEEYNAQNDLSVVSQIADRVALDPPDVVYVLGTPAAQTIQRRTPNVLLVQGAATDPVSAGLADSWEGSGRNYVATSDRLPASEQLKLIAELTPQVRRVGIIYNPGEVNSSVVVSDLRREAPARRIELVERPIANSSEMSQSLESMLGEIDAVFLPPDNTAYAGLAVVGRLTKAAEIPFYATVKDALDHNALATLGLDFEKLGRESAKLVLDVVAGRDPKTLPIGVNKAPTISISRTVASALGKKVDLAAFEHRSNVEIVK